MSDRPTSSPVLPTFLRLGLGGVPLLCVKEALDGPDQLGAVEHVKHAGCVALNALGGKGLRHKKSPVASFHRHGRLGLFDHEPGSRHIKLALEPGRYRVAYFTLCKAWVGTGNLHNQSEIVNVVGRIQQRDTQSFVDDLSERIAESRFEVLHHDIREET